MIRYRYNTQIEPPAPFIHVTLRSRGSDLELADVPAQLDPAADRTVIPGTFVDALNQIPLDEVPVSGYGGQVSFVTTYLLELRIQSFEPVALEVLAHAEEPYVLVGRDVLNRHRVVLDGPQQSLEIS
jgi:hypothetical protein